MVEIADVDIYFYVILFSISCIKSPKLCFLFVFVGFLPDKFFNVSLTSYRETVWNAMLF